VTGRGEGGVTSGAVLQWGSATCGGGVLHWGSVRSMQLQLSNVKGGSICL
jgi:hypothetical protein